MKKEIKVIREINQNHSGIKVTVSSNDASSDLDFVYHTVETLFSRKLAGENIHKEITYVSLINIEHLYTKQKSVYFQSDGIEYKVEYRLYELEQKLPAYFVRISHSEIVNIYHMKSLNSSFPGTIQLLLKNGTTVYVSRRYVNKVTQQIMEVVNHESY
ncbi:hypothetical protein AOC36_00495 [Erysipelothrix larvae]|uniref:HTH LytTR-type domain-containing protein n=1 Tax=Erysipelothrix larvae TaxID=1514105 RepID=A0A0X8GY17_9FIRM|nr:LytTR family DNA-binding domain-containing protein [Erysipelothrix larvae]AMC92524.1 hypothetical protein AOC36_00495 [Erysipelothrix larvae]